MAITMSGGLSAADSIRISFNLCVLSLAESAYGSLKEPFSNAAETTLTPYPISHFWEPVYVISMRGLAPIRAALSSRYDFRYNWQAFFSMRINEALYRT